MYTIPIDIEETIVKFNFPEVHSVMKFLDWCWVIRGEIRVPYAHEMIERATQLLLLADSRIDENSIVESNASSGGFKATCYYSKELKKKVYILEFILERKQSYYE
jgi:hypothetical protein